MWPRGRSPYACSLGHFLPQLWFLHQCHWSFSGIPLEFFLITLQRVFLYQLQAIVPGFHEMKDLWQLGKRALSQVCRTPAASRQELAAHNCFFALSTQTATSCSLLSPASTVNMPNRCGWVGPSGSRTVLYPLVYQYGAQTPHHNI